MLVLWGVPDLLGPFRGTCLRIKPTCGVPVETHRYPQVINIYWAFPSFPLLPSTFISSLLFLSSLSSRYPSHHPFLLAYVLAPSLPPFLHPSFLISFIHLVSTEYSYSSLSFQTVKCITWYIRIDLESTGIQCGKYYVLVSIQSSFCSICQVRRLQSIAKTN